MTLKTTHWICGCIRTAHPKNCCPEMTLDERVAATARKEERQSIYLANPLLRRILNKHELTVVAKAPTHGSP